MSILSFLSFLLNRPLITIIQRFPQYTLTELQKYIKHFQSQLLSTL